MRQQTLLFANSLAPRIPRKRKYEDALTKTTEYLHNGQVVRRYVDPTRLLFARPGKRRMPALLENNYNPDPDEDEDIPTDLPPLPVAPPPQPVAPPPQPVPAPPANTDVGHTAEGGNGMGRRIGEALVTGVTGVASYAGNTALNMAERAGNAAADVAYQGAAGFARGLGEGAGQRIGYSGAGVIGMIGAGIAARAAYNNYAPQPWEIEPYQPQRPDTPRVPGGLPELYDHNLRPPGVQATLGEYDRFQRELAQLEPYDHSRARRPPEVQRTLDEYERHQREYPQIAELPFHPDNDNGGEGSSTGARPARARLGEGLNALPFAREAEVDAPGGFRQLNPLRLATLEQLLAMDTPEAMTERLHRAGVRTGPDLARDMAMARADRAAGLQGPQVGWWNTYEQLENMGAEGAAELQRRVEQGFGDNVMPGDAANFDPFRIPRQVGQWGSQLFGGQRGGNIGFGLD